MIQKTLKKRLNKGRTELYEEYILYNIEKKNHFILDFDPKLFLLSPTYIDKQFFSSQLGI